MNHDRRVGKSTPTSSFLFIARPANSSPSGTNTDALNLTLRAARFRTQTIGLNGDELEPSALQLELASRQSMQRFGNTWHRVDRCCLNTTFPMPHPVPVGNPIPTVGFASQLNPTSEFASRPAITHVHPPQLAGKDAIAKTELEPDTEWLKRR